MRGLPGCELAAHAACWGIDYQPLLHARTPGELRVHTEIVRWGIELRVKVEEARMKSVSF